MWKISWNCRIEFAHTCNTFCFKETFENLLYDCTKPILGAKLHFLENEALNGQILLQIFYTFRIESANCQSVIGLPLHTASEFSKSVFSKTNIRSYIYTHIFYTYDSVFYIESARPRLRHPYCNIHIYRAIKLP